MDVRSLCSDWALAQTRTLQSDRVELVFGRCVTILFGLLSNDSRFLRKTFRIEESISKKYLSKKFSMFFFVGDLDVNFVVTVFDPNSVQLWLLPAGRCVVMGSYLLGMLCWDRWNRCTLSIFHFNFLLRLGLWASQDIGLREWSRFLGACPLRRLQPWLVRVLAFFIYVWQA